MAAAWTLEEAQKRAAKLPPGCVYVGLPASVANELMAKRKNHFKRRHLNRRMDELHRVIQYVADCVESLKKEVPISDNMKQELEARVKRRYQECLRQCGTLLKQILAHRWAWPFAQPVNVEALGLEDYNVIIEKPMDLGTIRSRLEGGHYKHPLEFLDDCRLVFSNAQIYNKRGSDIFVMAETLSAKFEEKWNQQIAPKISFIEDSFALDHITVDPRRTATLGDVLLGVLKELEGLELEAVSAACPLTDEELRDVSLTLPFLQGESAIEANQIFALLGTLNMKADSIEGMPAALQRRLHRAVSKWKRKTLLQMSSERHSKRRRILAKSFYVQRTEKEPDDSADIDIG